MMVIVQKNISKCLVMFSYVHYEGIFVEVVLLWSAMS